MGRRQHTYRWRVWRIASKGSPTGWIYTSVSDTLEDPYERRRPDDMPRGELIVEEVGFSEKEVDRKYLSQLKLLGIPEHKVSSHEHRGAED